ETNRLHWSDLKEHIEVWGSSSGLPDERRNLQKAMAIKAHCAGHTAEALAFLSEEVDGKTPTDFLRDMKATLQEKQSVDLGGIRLKLEEKIPIPEDKPAGVRPRVQESVLIDMPLETDLPKQTKSHIDQERDRFGRQVAEIGQTVEQLLSAYQSQ